MTLQPSSGPPQLSRRRALERRVEPLVIVGVPGETGRMEWVGVARAGAGGQEVRSLPRLDEILHEPGLVFRYEGLLLVESLVRLQYGITFSVPMATVRDFVGRHRTALQSRGYDLRRY